jgi:predicted GH43/DUF377 family glycosyl hydrolase
MKPLALLAASISLAGCGRGYAEFTLKPLWGGAERQTFSLIAFPDPVILPSDNWDSHDALNPSVVRKGGLLYNFYSGFDGRTWRTALATSPGGAAWHQLGVVLSPDPETWEGDYIAANGSALWANGQFWYWYVAGPRGAHRIGLARSPDGVHFTKTPEPVLGLGPFESWDERAVADPYVIQTGSDFYMYYLGQDRASPPRQRIGVARSQDGIHWTKFLGNPVLDIGQPGEFDEFELGEPAVFNYFDQGYWMIYTGSNFAQERRLGLARSTDGIHWSKRPLAVFPFSPGPLDAHAASTAYPTRAQPPYPAWYSRALCDATVLSEPGAFLVWFGGGDTASPDENLHGRIGYGVLQPNDGTLAK